MDDLSRTRPQNRQPAPADTIRIHKSVAAAGSVEASIEIRPQVPGYDIIETLGEGGMGIVFKAQELELGRTVALKMIHGATPSQAELIRFRAEALAVASIEHPNVVRVFSSGESAGRPYISMEYLGGGSLSDRLKNGRLPPREAADLVRKVALGIHAAHDAGIVHRDLKPANILFDSQGEPKVMDFGLAKVSDTGLTATNTIMGTAAYMAPEQARGESRHVGPAADVWALGVMLFECLTGQRPFGGKHNLEILDAVLKTEPPALRSIVPNIHADLQVIVQHCLEKDLSKRAGSAAEVAADLARWSRGEPIRARAADAWQVRFESTGLAISVASPASILAGLRSGDWETTDETRGPDDEDWRPIEDHPAFAEAVGELTPARVEPADETRLDMNPLIDVALVLLIFFILTTTVASLRRSIDIPAEPDDTSGKSAKVNPEEIRKDAFDVVLWMDGDTARVKIGESVVPISDLEREIIAHKRATEKRFLILSVEKSVPWGLEAGVHDAAKAAGVEKIFWKKYRSP